METLKADPILTLPNDTLNVIRKTYNLDKPGVMDAAIDILEFWLKKQDHFITKDFSRDYLERCIIRSKGSLERAKERFDGMCTAKTFLPEFFNDFIMVEPLREFYLHGYLPKLTQDYYRVYFFVNKGQNFSNAKFIKYYQRVIQLVEYTYAHDYSNGYIIACDFRTTNLIDLMKNIDISLMGKFVDLILKSYGARIKAIHLISGSKLINLFVNLLKQILAEKIMNRIHVHSELEMLYEHLEKDILPKDFGGNAKSCKELNELWHDVVSSEEHVKYMKKMNAAKTDESLRRTGESNNQYLGIPGTFRSLNVD